MFIAGIHLCPIRAPIRTSCKHISSSKENPYASPAPPDGIYVQSEAGRAKASSRESVKYRFRYVGNRDPLKVSGDCLLSPSARQTVNRRHDSISTCICYLKFEMAISESSVFVVKDFTYNFGHPLSNLEIRLQNIPTVSTVGIR